MNNPRRRDTSKSNSTTTSPAPKREEIRKILPFFGCDIVFFKRKKDKGTCNCLTPNECKEDISQCQYDIRNCPKKRSLRKKRYSAWKSIAFIALSIVFFFILNHYSDKFGEKPDIYNLLMGIIISIIAASIAALIIDFPARLREYQKLIIDAITDYSYLSSLNEAELTTLRKATTRQLHAKDIPNIPVELIEIDHLVCDLMKKQYYKKYRHTIICDETDNGQFVKKKNTIYYELINPYGGEKDLAEVFTHSFFVKCGNDADLKKYLNFQKMRITIDNKHVQDYAEKLDYKAERQDKQLEFYDTKIELVNKDTEEKNIEIRFYHSLKCEFYYEVLVPVDDICFTARLKYPASDYRLDYSYNSKNVKLHGQLFGTEITQSNIRTIYEQDNSMSLEAFGWMLPQNGAIVVAVKKNGTKHGYFG
jgi:hypothetical protein